jgi:hypothetical protein
MNFLANGLPPSGNARAPDNHDSAASLQEGEAHGAADAPELLANADQ